MVQCSEAVWITTVRVAQSTLNHLHFIIIITVSLLCYVTTKVLVNCCIDQTPQDPSEQQMIMIDLTVFQELKLRFFYLMIELDQHEGAYLDICKHYRAIYDTPIIKEDAEKWKKVRQ